MENGREGGVRSRPMNGRPNFRGELAFLIFRAHGTRIGLKMSDNFVVSRTEAGEVTVTDLSGSEVGSWTVDDGRIWLADAIGFSRWINEPHFNPLREGNDRQHEEEI